MDGEQIVHEVAEKVRELINDAEARAAKIVREAETEAKGIRERAAAESQERLAAARNAFEELQTKLGIGAEVQPGPVSTRSRRRPRCRSRPRRRPARRRSRLQSPSRP